MSKSKRPPIAVERLREVLRYDPEGGTFVWLARIAIRIVPGTLAGSPDGKGYLRASIDGRRYRLHQLAWAYMTGEWSAADIDHKDGDKLNNKWGNLRQATHSQNHANRKLSRVNTSGLKGVSWDRRRRKWIAQIGVQGSNIYLGSFASMHDAHSTYVAAAERYFGSFARAA